MTATQEATFGGVDQTGGQVRLEWVIYFPWNRAQKKFEGDDLLDPSATAIGCCPSIYPKHEH
jgi:hypothetical protein